MYIEVHTIQGPNGGVNALHVSDEAAKLAASALEVGLEGADSAHVAEAYGVLRLLRGEAVN